MLDELFQFFLKHPDSMPPGYRASAEGGALHRVVCDYIAGMTDGFVRRTYRRVFENGESPQDELRNL
jgi:dGTPase